VIAIIIMLLGIGAIIAADRAISGRRSDPDKCPRYLPRRLRPRHSKAASAGARAPADAHRRPALFPIELELAGTGQHQRDLRKGRQSRHRPGPGPEQNPSRRSRACPNRCSNRGSPSPKGHPTS
jgi:hypothetical protein